MLNTSLRGSDLAMMTDGLKSGKPTTLLRKPSETELHAHTLMGLRLCHLSPHGTSPIDSSVSDQHSQNRAHKTAKLSRKIK